MKKLLLGGIVFLCAGLPFAFGQSSPNVLFVPPPNAPRAVPQDAVPFPGNQGQAEEKVRDIKPVENEFLKLRGEFRAESDDLKNEYLDARNEIRNTAQDEALRIREETRGEIGEVKSEARTETREIRQNAREMEEERAEVFAEKRIEAREEAKRIREEAMEQVGALRAESFGIVQQKREDFVGRIEEERREFKEELEIQRGEVEKKIQERRVEREANIEKIQDERKKEILVRVDENLNELNKRMLDRFSSALEQIERVLANIVTRADKAEAGGQDVNAVRMAVENARSAISAARDLIIAQAPKVYSFSITTEEMLRTDVAAARDALKNDLQVVKNAVDAARTATHAAAEALAQIPNVDGYDFDTTASEAAENTTQSQ